MNNFSDYILTYTTTPEDTFAENFVYLEQNNVINETNYLILSHSIQDIGFNFQLNDITYNKLMISLFGFVTLIDPNNSSPTTSSILNEIFMVGSLSTGSINLLTTHNNVLIAPWFSEYILPSYNYTESGKTEPGPYSGGKQSGVTYYKSYNNKYGKYFSTRWNILNAPTDSSLSKEKGLRSEFECVLTENGKIYFNYKKIDLSRDEDLKLFFYDPLYTTNTTCGVFLCTGSLRDFSSISDPTLYSGSYKYGGYISGSFTENEKPYRNSLNLKNNWPGGTILNTSIHFTPNSRHFRKIAPRKVSNKPRKIDSIKYFDDRLTKVNLTGSNIFPFVNQRFYANGTPLSEDLQDLYSNDTIEISNTCEVRSQNVNFINSIEYKQNNPSFTEEAFYEENSSSEVFIKNITLENLYNIKMFEKTASMYYYDFDAKTFLVYDTGSVINPENERISFKNNDQITYSPTGFHLVSASSMQITPNLTDFYERLAFSSRRNTKLNFSVFETNSSFINKKDRFFRLGLKNNDLILDDVEIEFGYKAGTGWFDDVTNYQYYSGSALLAGQIGTTNLQKFDTGGPGITVALINIRDDSTVDTIAKAFITHENDYDYINNTSIQHITGGAKEYIKRIRIKGYNEPDFVISNSIPTGSVRLNLKPKLSNGVNLLTSYQPTNHIDFLKQEYVELNTISNNTVMLREIEPFSRNNTGEDFSQRSETVDVAPFNTSKFTGQNKVYVKNHFYSGSMSNSDYSYLVANGANKRYMLVSNLYAEKASSYRLKNGDKLTLLISKCRPSIPSGSIPYAVSGSHDFVISDQDVKIKLVGRYTKDQDDVIESNYNNRLVIDGFSTNYDMDHIFDQSDKKYRSLSTSSISGSILTSNFTPSYSPTGFSGFRAETTLDNIDYYSTNRYTKLNLGYITTVQSTYITELYTPFDDLEDYI